jgi:hypothetical protein
MKNGFELLKSRMLNNEIDFTALEKRYGVSIPPLFKVFASSFILGDELIYTDRYKTREMEFFYASYFVYKPNTEVRFAGFNNVEKAIGLIEVLDVWKENKYIPIGHCGFNGAVLLGTQGTEEDKIILHNLDSKIEFVNLCDNIFEFVRGLFLEPIEESGLKDGIMFEQLYKNWGEDFWRVRVNK